MMHRVASAPIMSFRLSIRSDIAPVKSEKRSQGSLVEIVIPEIKTGSLVSSAARRGKAVRNIPSPVQDEATESHKRRKLLPSSGFSRFTLGTVRGYCFATQQ
jgi:hypothetical protein